MPTSPAGRAGDAVLALDIGGTKTAAAVVRDGVLDRLPSAPTPTDSAVSIEELVVSYAVQAAERGSLTGVGLSVAGFIDGDRARVNLAPNLPLTGHDLGGRLTTRLGLPVWVENDVNAAAWGEFRAGRATSSATSSVSSAASPFVLVMVGTGLGGGVVVEGRLLRGGRGAAGEIGHLELVEGGRPCGCGLRGCWEQYASGTALVRRAREELAAGRASTLAELSEPVTGHDVLKAARGGDELARELYAELGVHLGRGIAMLSVVIDPSLVVLGGGVAAASDFFLPSLQATLAARTDRALPLPTLVCSTLGGDAPLLGMADLAAAGFPG